MFFKKIVECADCGCLINRDSASKVEVCAPSVYINIDEYYCGKCAKPYNMVIQDYYGKFSRYRSIEVNEKGEPVGYKKLTK